MNKNFIDYNKSNISRDNYLTVLEEVQNCFRRCFQRDGLELGYTNLSLKSTRDEILQNIPENTVERFYLDNNYEKILNDVKDEFISLQLKNSLENSNLIEIAKSVGYNPNKKYSVEEINSLTQTVNGYIQDINNQKIQETKNFFFNLIVLLAYIFIIGIIPFLFFYGYFTLTK